MVVHDRPVRGAAVAVSALLLVASAMLPLRAADIAETGLSMIPDDAAFVSATLRAREQYDRIVKSRAFRSLQALPGVTRAMESLAEQRTQPGNPLSMVDAFMQMPENQQALDVLASMVATDTFVYGEPSCIAMLQLLQKVQQAQQAANIISGAGGGMLEFGDFDGIELDELQDDIEEDEEDEDDDAAVRRRVRARPARFQRVEAVEIDVVEGLSSEELAARMMIETIAANLDLLVMPDLVWGFRIADKAAATSQLARVEQLLKLASQASPDLADAVGRKTIHGGEFVTFSFDPDVAAFREAMREIEGLDDEVGKIVEQLDEITVVFAIGIIGDRVIISLGDSTDHLEKLRVAGNGKQGLLATKPFAALLDHRGKPITGVSYASEPLMKAISPSAAGIRQMAELIGTIVASADLPAEAAADARRDLEATAAEYEKWLPVPGPWLAFSFLSEQGYEGYVWDWAKNSALDGTKRLELLEHAGGAPLVALVIRTKTDVKSFDDVVTWVRRGWKFFEKHVVPTFDDDGVRERIADVKKHLFPLAESYVTTIRTKFVPALADGQVGLVLDAKSKTKRLHRDLPASDAALPLLEPAIVLGLDDPKLFREGLSDLFALFDDLVDAIREIAPDAVPADYRVAEPEKAKVEGGTVWSWKLEKAGLDEQVRPTVAVGEEAAVLALVPKQAERMIVESKLETGSQLTAFDDPLAAAAVVDTAGFIEALQPWVAYAVRYGCLQARDGSVDADTVLDAAAETPEAKDALEQAKTVYEVMKCLRVFVAESKTTPEASVTHWRNVIRDVK